jgi:hypothetical protein
MDRSPNNITVKEMKEILNNYSDNDKIFILSLHYDNYSIAVLNVSNADTRNTEEILYDKMIN